MLRFTVEHKYNGMLKVVEGSNVWNALKDNNLDYRVWIVTDIEQVR